MRLARFILENMEPILMEWEEFARAIQPADHQMEVTELRDHAQDMLRVIAEDIQIPQTENERDRKSKGRKSRQSTDTAAETHAIERLGSGFSIKLLASEYRALRASVLKLWKCEDDGDTRSIEDIIRFNESIDQALAESVERYSEAVSLQQDVFIGILGHDLRAPLQSLSHGTQFLMQGKATDSSVIKLAARMHNSVGRMAGMINNLLDFTQTRIGGGMNIVREHAVLAEVAEQVVEEFRSYNPERDIRYEIKGDCIGEWDAGRVAQIFQNLIANALQYGAKDKPITVETEDQKDEVIIKVHNYGSPIPETEQQRLFDLLYRHSHATNKTHFSQNLGLGLYIVREVAIAHGGRVSVSSSEKEGTQFTVRLHKKNSAMPRA